MPSIFTHSFVGIISASIFKTTKFKIKFFILSIICPVLPDLDVLAFKFGIPYEHFFGHRGFFHSLSFAFLLAAIIILIFFWSKEIKFKSKFGLLLYFFILTASHGILDAFTSGGLGIALLSPFDNTRYFFPYTPIKVSPLGISAFFGEWGKRVIISEMLWVWLPLIILFILVKVILWIRYNRLTR
ncbi:MAG: metal-dependent hydrolase [Calditrichaceae bacterium]